MPDLTNIVIALLPAALALVGAKRIAAARTIARVVKTAALMLPEASAAVAHSGIVAAIKGAARAMGIGLDAGKVQRAAHEIILRRAFAELALKGEQIPVSVRRWRKQLDAADRALIEASEATTRRRTMGDPDDDQPGAGGAP